MKSVTMKRSAPMSWPLLRGSRIRAKYSSLSLTSSVYFTRSPLAVSKSPTVSSSM